jgi:uncharacterized RDD family membrane protein YckC
MQEDRPPSPGILRRLLGMGYELLLILALLAVAVLLPHLLIAASTHYLATPLVLWAHLFATLLAYFVWFWSHGRQTLPMKTWRIRLVTHDGLPLRPTQALWRYLWSWPSILLGGVGLIWALIDREGQFLHDRLAGTRLIQER